MNPSSVINQRSLSRTMASFSTSRRVCSTLFGLLCCTAMLFIIPGITLAEPAHAEYVSSDPAENAMLAKAPTTITIHFAEQVEPVGSNIIVYDVNGNVVSTAAAQVDRADLKTMTVPMKDDKSEIYVVDWYNVSAVEGHHDAGSFRFFVNISPMLKGMLGGQSMSGSSSMTSTSSSSLSPGLPVWLTALIGALVGAVVVFIFNRLSKASRKVE